MTLFNKDKIIVYSKTTCPWCKKAKKYLEDYDLEYEVIDLDKSKNMGKIREQLITETKQNTVPNIFIGDYHVGGYTNLQNLGLSGELEEILVERGF